MSFNYSPRLVTDGLYLYLDAGNSISYPGSGTAWTDLSRNYTSLSGSIGGTVAFDSTNGGSIVYDGTSTYFRTTSQFNPSAAGFTAITYGFWLKIAFSAGVHQTLLGCGYQGPIGYQWIFRVANTNVLYCQYSNGTAAANHSYGNVFTGYNDTWMNVVVSVDYSTGATVCYRNGIAVASSTMTTPVVPVNFYYYVGAYTAPTNGLLNGNVSNVALYSRVLTASEVLQNYNCLKGRFGY